jgi:ArsR family transcriptional regulator, virulence genes transcriptional regulator
MDVKQFDLAAAQASDLIRALAHPARLRIVCALSGKECSVTGLSESAGAPIAAISRHLALLRKDRIVRARRARQTMYYSPGDPRIGKFVAALAETFRPAPR